MKKFTNYTRGFTLIELLVVVAIIGILASVILVSLNSARNKAKDARIISDVQQLRTQIESDSSGSNYVTAFTGYGTAHVFSIGGASSGGTVNMLVADALSNAGTCPSGSNCSTATSTSDAATGASITNTAAITVITDGVMGTATGASNNFGWTTVPSKYAIWGRLSTGNWFCIDSTGDTKNPSTATLLYTMNSCQ